MRSFLDSIPREWQAALVDSVLVTFAYLGTLLLLPFTGIPRTFGDAVSVAVMVAIMIACLYAFKVYQRIWSRTSGHSVNVLLGAALVATLIGILVEVAFRPRLLSPNSILMANAFAFGGLVGIRYRSRLISGFQWRWRIVWHNEFPPQPTRVLIIGAGESGQTLALRLQHRPNGIPYQIVGFVDDDPAKQKKIIEGCMVLGTRDDIVRLVQEKRIDLIVVAIHTLNGVDFRDILERCESTPARIKIAPDLLGIMKSDNQGAPLRDVLPEDLLGRSVITRHEEVDLSSVTQKIILITGAAGSIGSELSRQIMDYQPLKVLLLDNNESGLHDLHLELQTRHPRVTIVPLLADITQHATLRTIFAAYYPQVIFHAAAYKHVPMLQYHPLEALRVNALGTFNLTELALTFGVERFVLISTDKAVHPSSVMGASKRACELLLHALAQTSERNTLFTAVRFGNVLNSRGSVVPIFERQIASGGPVTVTDREMTRYFMSIPEAVNLIIHAACLTDGDDLFILRMGEVVRIVELAERMIRLHGLRPYQDIAIEFTGVRPGEKMHEELFSDAEQPVPTIHPGIVKLDAWHDAFDADEFLRGMHELLHDATLLADPTRVLGRLQALISGKRSPLATAARLETMSWKGDPVETQY